MSTSPQTAWVPHDSFANRLVLVRRELGLNVKEAAARCGLHYATWSTWENGRKPADMVGVVDSIHQGLGVERSWLMWGVAENPRPEGPGGGSVVRHQGLEPRTRWFEAFAPDLRVLQAA